MSSCPHPFAGPEMPTTQTSIGDQCQATIRFPDMRWLGCTLPDDGHTIHRDISGTCWPGITLDAIATATDQIAVAERYADPCARCRAKTAPKVKTWVSTNQILCRYHCDACDRHWRKFWPQPADDWPTT